MALTAEETEALRKEIERAKDAVRNYNTALNDLTGSSNRVKAAKEQLERQLNLEKKAISDASTALVKQGEFYNNLQKKTKAQRDTIADLRIAMSGLQGPHSALTEKFRQLERILTKTSESSLLVAGGIVAVTTVIVGLSKALIDGTKSFITWGLEAANTLRSMDLLREASLGSAENAKNMGDQIRLATESIPLSTKALNDLGVELGKTFLYSRITGQGIVDVFNAVGQETAAMGDKAGKQIEELLSRGKRWGRFTLGMFELEGTGLQFTDVAGELAKQLGIGMNKAQFMLMSRGADLTKAAAAVRSAIEKKFGGINLRKNLDLNVQIQRLKDSMMQLTSGINFDKILESFSRLSGYFDVNNASGKVLKDLITRIGDGIGNIFDTLTRPEVLDEITIQLLTLENDFLDLAITIKDATGVNILKPFNDMKSATTAVRAGFILFEVTLATVALTLGVIGVAVGTVVLAIYGWFKAFAAVGTFLGDLAFEIKTKFDMIAGWSVELGENLWKGIVNGITAGITHIKNAASKVVTALKSTFTGGLEIQSPSKVFEQYGKYTSEGFAQGVDKGSPQVNNSLSKMVSPQSKSGGIAGGAGGLSGSNISATVNVYFPNVKDGKEAAATMAGNSFRAQFTQMLEQMLVGAGVPTQTPQGSVT